VSKDLSKKVKQMANIDVHPQSIQMCKDFM